MNILLITPFYAINEDIKLTEDNRAIHYFTAEWVKQGHNVKVINTYFNSVNSLKNFIIMLKSLSKNELKYSIDGVDTQLMINNKFKKGLPILNNKKTKKLVKEIKENIDNIDVLVFHFPSIYITAIKQLMITHANKISIVYHMLDIKNIKQDIKKKRNIDTINNSVRKIGFRSNRIQKEFIAMFEQKYSHKYFNVISGIGRKEIIALNDKKIKHPTDKLKFLFVGKLIKQKNADKLLKAFKELDEKYYFTIKIIGTGPEKESLINLEQKLNFKNHVAFLGHISRNEVFEHMFYSDVFILPSYHETLGLVYLEAMSQGCITIGSKNEGIDGIIENGKNGFLIDLNKKEDLLLVIENIFKLDKREKRDIIKAGLETMRMLTAEKVAVNYLKEISSEME